MTTYPEAAARIDLEVMTPNEQLFGRLRGKYDVTITIAPGYAARAGDRETAVQLGRLCRLIFVHRAERLQRIEEQTMQPGAPEPETEKDHEFARRYEQLSVSETSSDATMTLTVVGLSTWSWEIAPGTADRRGSDGVAASATEVANAVALRLADEVRLLNIRVYHDHE
ncbi:hypothetical protein NPS01_03710 [Nocardioides psychrotolerans]|uniref:Uncharacterized protein n=1 Tax=Nocardioides psychrotolerans TaxID=1005945 RepID=A0A1I3BD21_9ACTN|nr:hypothetical protein [Nocardioides psychrotolerans]GEP36708.1 hypothetical protein NPS01_03710 [Nocardioides psychrotolerans]SFH60178.1 hypothetical protein SAMN05216561_10169 [Nocardioides psychrotolerans]